IMPDTRKSSVARCMTAALSAGMRFAEASLIPRNVSSSAITCSPWLFGFRTKRVRGLRGRRRARVPSGGVLADGPAALGEITLAGFDRRGFELGCHRVVEAVEEAEEGDHRDDVDDLRLAVMFLQLREIGVGDRVRHLRRTLGDPEGRALCFGEERARLIFP